MKQLSVRIAVDLDGHLVGQQLTYEEATKLILDIDLSMADCDFTENLIIKLMESMRKELTNEEYSELVEKIK